MKGVRKSILWIVFILYMVILMKVIVLKYYSIQDAFNQIYHFRLEFLSYGWEEANFIPFHTIIDHLFLSKIPLMAKLEGILTTLIAFAPLGAILPLLSKLFLPIKYTLFTVVSISIVFEMLQWIFKFGIFDVDDVLLYTLGSLVGYLPIKALQLLKQSTKARLRNMES
ncbi:MULTISPECIES: VanZ family protein [Bacillus]|uniref:VanZ family protein n=1 Tax=Bacillus TaxID=1386 RepID=UPI0002D44BF4|nr:MULTISPECIES: VanZ family protein [Bacillus]